MKKSIPALVPGQRVAIANCRETGRIVARLGKNRYSVEYLGQIIEICRQNLFPIK
jgi:hypothetical protein